MDFEKILAIIQPRPSIWLRLWLFFFLLINRKEGKRLLEAIEKKLDENFKILRRLDESNEKLMESNEKLRESEERRREAEERRWKPEGQSK
jgi:hypothetical protein